MSPTQVRAQRPWARACSAVLSTSRQPCRGSSAGNVAGFPPVPVTTTSAPIAASATAVARLIPCSRPALSPALLARLTRPCASPFRCPLRRSRRAAASAQQMERVTRNTATVSRVCSRSVTAAGEAAARDCSQRRSPRHRPAPATLCPCRVSSCRAEAPLVGGHEAAIGTACIPPKLLLVVQVGREAPPECEHDPGCFPWLEPPPTGRGAAISPGRLAPWGARPEHPEEAFKAAPIGIRGRPPRSAAFGGGRWTRRAAPCCCVRLRHAMSCLPMLSGHSWRDDTSMGRS
jgi:hypothetical protein